MTVTRQRRLEMLLQRVPAPAEPKADLEQVPTPAPVAAWLGFTARSAGDVEGRRVADLGCGTGVLALAAALSGADSVVGVDADPDALAQAHEAEGDVRAALSDDEADGVVDVDWVEADVADWAEGPGAAVDTVVMNPPFGARRRGADRPFLEAAMSAVADARSDGSPGAVWSFHLAETEDFVRGFVAGLGGEVVETWPVDFPVPHQHRYQREAERRVEVLAVRIEVPRGSGPGPGSS